MRKRRVLLLLPACVVLLAGCAMHRTPVMPPEGMIYTHLKAPLTVDFNQTPRTDGKVGSASTFFLYIPFTYVMSFGWDRCDLEVAAERGQITTVHYADYEVTKVLGIFGMFTIHAHGE